MRRQRPDLEQTGWSRLRGRIGLWPALALVVFFAGATGIALFGQPALRYSVGESITQPIPARVQFKRLNPVKTEELKASARAATPSYYRVNRALIARILQDLNEFHDAFDAAASYEEFAALAEERGWPMTRDDFERIKAAADEAVDDAFRASAEALATQLATERIHDPKKESRDPPATKAIVVDESAGDSAPLDIADFTPSTQRVQVNGRASELSQVFRYPIAGMQAVVKRILVSRLLSEPLLIYDQSRAQQEMQQAEASAGEQYDVFEKGKPVVAPRPGLGLTAADVELLAQEEAAYQAFLAESSPEARAARQQRFLERLGLTVILFLISLGLYAYVGLYHRRILDVRSRTAAFAALLLAMLLAARLIDLTVGIKELTLAPVLVAASILTIVYAHRFAAGVMSLAGVLAVLTVRGQLELFVALLLGAAVTVYLLTEIRTRTRIITVGGLVGLLLFVTSFSFGLAARQELGFVTKRGLYAALAAVAAAMFVTAALPYIEKAFGIATALTLLEWRDPTRPLLQRLAREAPGTYNHSLVLGTMADAACETIGANGLLAQVGALYHDVGKIVKPEYFAENQVGSISRHDHLSPSMSLLIIIGHVKDGVELAKEYNLPRVLYRFIEEHHGTTLVRYFHHVASQKQPQIASGKHDREVSEVEFRYPGPRPHSKETAVLMLSDSVEGAVRALPEPSAGRIECAVHQIVMDRLNDGQFDECDITLKELHRIEESLVKSLVRFYHGRVAYPKAKAATGAPMRPAGRTA